MILKEDLKNKLDINEVSYQRHVDSQRLIEIVIDGETYITKESFEKFKSDGRLMGFKALKG